MSLSPATLRWAELIAEQERSGLTSRAFAERRGINPSTLAWWRSKLRAARQRTSMEVRQAATFVEVTVEPVRECPIRLRFDHRPVVLEVADGASVELLRRVVEALC